MSESMMYIFLAIIAVLAVAEIVMAVLLIAWRGKLNDEADSMHRYSELIGKLFQETRDYEKKLSERMLIFAERSDHQSEIYKEVIDSTVQIIEQNERIIQTHNDIVDKYNDIAKSYNEFLNAQKGWYKGIDDKYSASYDQFKLCTDKLKELSYQISDLANMSTEDEYSLTLHEACDTVCLDCPYDSCKCDTCPVYAIKHNNQPDIKFNEIPYDRSIIMPDFSNAAERSAEILNQKHKQRENEAELEETDEFLRRKACNEWTEDDYRDAVNTYPEDILEGADDDK